MKAGFCGNEDTIAPSTYRRMPPRYDDQRLAIYRDGLPIYRWLLNTHGSSNYTDADIVLSLS